jgi:predicted dehydrogenase
MTHVEDPRSAPPIRWGILGAGGIAGSFADAVTAHTRAQLVAVGSRNRDRSSRFATAHGIPTTHLGYRDLVANPQVDAVYVATPHSEHREHALLAIAAGKHVLVEKAFTRNTGEAQEVFEAARAAGVFVMEAMWTRFQPAVVALRELVADGAIGEVRSIQADLGVRRDYDPADRLFDLALGGGALLDLGVYVVSFAQMLLGTPERVVATGSLFPSGTDAEAVLLLDYAGGRSATLTTSLRYALPGQARVFGTTGWIDVLPRFHHPQTIVLHRAGAEPETLTRPQTGGGYSHELIEVTECLRAGRTESAVMPLADTLVVQTVLGEAAELLGVLHSEDPGVV